MSASQSALDGFVHAGIGFLFSNHGYGVVAVACLLVVLFLYLRRQHSRLQVRATYIGNAEELKRLDEDRKLSWEKRQQDLEVDAQAAKAKMEEIERKKRLDKLEDMAAAAEGRTSKARPPTQDWRDNGHWSRFGGPGGGKGGSNIRAFKPPERPAGGGG